MGHNRPVTTDVKEDAVLRDAQGLAHDAVVDEMGAQLVGSHLGFAMEAERFGTHAFACDDPAYVGWQWAVSVSRVPRGKAATICEIILLPQDLLKQSLNTGGAMVWPLSRSIAADVTQRRLQG